LILGTLGVNIGQVLGITDYLEKRTRTTALKLEKLLLQTPCKKQSMLMIGYDTKIFNVIVALLLT
jgi:hypothetical protein